MSTRRTFVGLAMLAFTLSAIGCEDLTPPKPEKPPKPVVKLTVTRKGEYIVDGATVDLAGLDAAFADAQAKGADVWCYRETPGEPPQAYLELMKFVAKYKILLQYVSQPDFSVPPVKKPLTITY